MRVLGVKRQDHDHLQLPLGRWSQGEMGGLEFSNISTGGVATYFDPHSDSPREEGGSEKAHLSCGNITAPPSLRITPLQHRHCMCPVCRALCPELGSHRVIPTPHLPGQGLGGDDSLVSGGEGETQPSRYGAVYLEGPALPTRAGVTLPV